MERASVDYKVDCQRFVLDSKNYVQQYNLLYIARLEQMRPIIRAQAQRKWGASAPILSQIIDIEDITSTGEHHLQQQEQEQQQECVVIGTIYKEMQLRGSVLDEFKSKSGIPSTGIVEPLHNIASESDSLVLEDASGRVSLGGALLNNSNNNHTDNLDNSSLGVGKGVGILGRLVTGVVVAVKGAVDELGVMQVTDWTFAFDVTRVRRIPAAIPPPGTVTEAEADAAADSKYILLVSGLQVGQPPSLPAAGSADDSRGELSSDLSLKLLADFVSGHVGGSADLKIARNIVRVIIAGNSVAAVDPAELKERALKESTGARALRLAHAPGKQLDMQLAQLLTSIDVDILPGATDPTNIAMPQQPLHPCLFPHSSRFSTFHRVTNPYQATLTVPVSITTASEVTQQQQQRRLSILGHSGQPVRDIARLQLRNPDTHHDCSDATHKVEGRDSKDSKDSKDCSCLDILEDTLRWGHLCPTCPDTLSCYPYTESDPFVLQQSNNNKNNKNNNNDQPLPQILFAGSQPAFGTRRVRVNCNKKTATATAAAAAAAQASNEAKGSAGEAATTALPVPQQQEVRLVTIPEFGSSGTAVLINISSEALDCFSINLR